MSIMALSPDTAAALKQALDAVIQECGNTPGYEDLVAKLQDAEAAIPADHGHADHQAPPAHGDHAAEPTDPHAADDHGAADTQSADDMFAAAQAEHTARRKGAKPNPSQHGA